MDAVAVDVIVLNFNGASLLDECLPTIVRAAAASRHRCRLIAIDNGSTDDSAAIIAERFPEFELRHLPNRGLCSFNEVLRDSSARAAVLLNNDIKAAPDALDPLIEPLLARPVNDRDGRESGEPIVFTAPHCTLFDGATHEGLKTAVRLRFGLVTATSHFADAETVADISGPTASAGAVLAVDREAFVALGGFDAAYLPGRIEDLDFCFRVFQAGYRGWYAADSHFQHQGGATFQAAFGRRGCDRLALRNTLLFQRRRLRCVEHRGAFWFWVPIRAMRDVLQAPWIAPSERFAFCRAWFEARRIQRSSKSTAAERVDAAREREFFRRHAPQQLSGMPSRVTSGEERQRDARYPISRWYLRPAACAAAEKLARLGVRPNQVTACGLICAVLAAVALFVGPATTWVAAALILAAWFCDRVDGPLARLSGTAGPLGAWIDANVDEVVDLGLHTACAAAAARAANSPFPWFCLIGFLVGKYLLMHGLSSHDDVLAASREADLGDSDSSPESIWRTFYHWPANADVRTHLLIVAVATGWLTAELFLLAVYYNLRWLARYVLLARRVSRATATRAST